ncbi:hypothetical protein M413DRAFT_449107 [Hebeloma cylindrosporum]|uniref:Dienelactone hydrolase domain-containing protein n=1 Tax=Hebeloma cylindrosporum TaxID=76867 RepID=A0A0C3BIP2_HEBCY|nr:hypothetical protein M413DRAFT_449107 [Hebeloma cylindrosporum h7]
MICPQCSQGSFLPGEPTGTFSDEFQGAYFAPGPGEGPSKRAVLYLTDAFGLDLKNSKIMADEFAKRLECDVWIPDYFAGKPLLPVDCMVLPDRAGVKYSPWTWIKFFFAIVLPSIPSIIRNRPANTDPRVISLIGLLKEKKQYEKIGAVGYCFGGATSVRLGSTDLVDSIIIAHPGTFTLDQAKAIKVPVSWVCAEDDMFFPDSLRDKCEAAFAARDVRDDFVDHEFIVYKGLWFFNETQVVAESSILFAHRNCPRICDPT